MAAKLESSAVPPAPVAREHALSPAYLALLPMFLSYELGVHALGGIRRNAAQEFLGLWSSPFGEYADPIRWALLVSFAFVALYLCRRHGIRVRATVARIWLEGLVVALTLGPALVGLTALLARWIPRLDVSWDATRAPPGLGSAALLFGGAVYEELVFRIGLYGLLFWASVRAARGLGLLESASRWSAEAFALVGSSVAFAAFHFERFSGWIWPGGLQYSSALFLWLSFAGMLLGVIYRWRGPGVAALAHGLFNLGLLVGIDPDVLA